MFLILGKREVLTTFDKQKYFQAKQRLIQAGIPHYSKMTNNRLGNFGNVLAMSSGDVKYEAQYRIFVSKAQAEEAIHCIQKSEDDY